MAFRCSGETMEAFEDGHTADIRCDLIDADFNYRRRYSADAMASLRADIRLRGIVQRVVLRPGNNGRFQLVVGHRRYRAFVQEFGAQAAIKSEIRLLTDQEATGMMAAENGERENPSAIEDAELAARMLGIVQGDRDEAARRLGWERRKFDRRVALMNATQKVRDAYLDDRLKVGHVEVFAALRKEVQDRVVEVMLQADKIPSVEQLMATAEQSLQSLDAAIFERAECAACQYNTGNQQALFDQSFSGSRCTNRDCYGRKTEAELEARRGRLADTYQVVRIVRSGDNATVIALRGEGRHAVGAEQAGACRTCADFGACVSAVPDSLGKTYTDICFNQACHATKVQAHRQQQEALSAGAIAASGAGLSPALDAHEAARATSSTGAPVPEPAVQAVQKASRASSSLRNGIREYREEIWRAVFHRAVLRLPVAASRSLLIALVLHRSSYLDGGAALQALKEPIGLDVEASTEGLGKLLAQLLALDQASLTAAFQQLPAHVTRDMPIANLVQVLMALDVPIESFWKVNETFFGLLTKTELDAVCLEIGLAQAAGKTYPSLKNGTKKDFVAAMLKVQGFRYEGAIPKLMRWTPGA
jgi:ParB family chromosome partitioning protein